MIILQKNEIIKTYSAKETRIFAQKYLANDYKTKTFNKNVLFTTHFV